VARIKPGTLGSLVPLWTQTQPSTSRAPRVERKERSTLPQDILAWVQLSEAIGKDEGLIGSVASRIQRKWRESELADKRQEHRDKLEAEEHKRRLAAAHAAAGTPEAGYADELQSQLMRKRAAGELYPERGSFVDPAAPLAAPVAPPAAAPAAPATTTPGFQVGQVDVPGRPAAPQIEEITAGIRARRGAAGPVPSKAFTVSELIGMAYDARSGEEYRAIASQLPDVMETDPGMGGRSLAGLIFGTDPKERAQVKRDMMKSFLEGQKHRRISDEDLALKRRVDALVKAGKLGHDLADIESKIEYRAARARAAKATATSKELSPHNKRLLDDWGDYYAGNLKPWMKGKTKGQVSAGLRRRSKGNAALFFRGMNDVTRDASEAKTPLTADQRMELRAIRSAQNTAQRTIEKLKVEAGTIEKIVDSDHYRKQLKESLKNLFRYQRDYVRLADLYKVDTDMIADVAEQYRDELRALGVNAPRPEKPKEQDSAETPAETPTGRTAK